MGLITFGATKERKQVGAQETNEDGAAAPLLGTTQSTSTWSMESQAYGGGDSSSSPGKLNLT